MCSGNNETVTPSLTHSQPSVTRARTICATHKRPQTAEQSAASCKAACSRLNAAFRKQQRSYALHSARRAKNVPRQKSNFRRVCNRHFGTRQATMLSTRQQAARRRSPPTLAACRRRSPPPLAAAARRRRSPPPLATHLASRKRTLDSRTLPRGATIGGMGGDDWRVANGKRARASERRRLKLGRLVMMARILTCSKCTKPTKKFAVH